MVENSISKKDINLNQALPGLLVQVCATWAGKVNYRKTPSISRTNSKT